MLDNLYENIGGKIKNWAKWIFIVEAIGAVMAGIALITTDDDLILAGILTLFCGPIVAYVCSWILYAFGELVEDVHAIRNKEGTAAEEKAKYEAKKSNPKVYNTNLTPSSTPKSVTVNVPYEKWNKAYADQGKTIGLCEMCGKKKCPVIFAEFEDFFGKAERTMCYDCFSKRDCVPKHKF